MRIQFGKNYCGQVHEQFILVVVSASDRDRTPRCLSIILHVFKVLFTEYELLAYRRVEDSDGSTRVLGGQRTQQRWGDLYGCAGKQSHAVADDQIVARLGDGIGRIRRDDEQ